MARQRNPRGGSSVGRVKRGLIDCKLQPRASFDDGVSVALQLCAIVKNVYATAAAVLRQQVLSHHELQHRLHILV